MRQKPNPASEPPAAPEAVCVEQSDLDAEMLREFRLTCAKKVGRIQECQRVVEEAETRHSEARANRKQKQAALSSWVSWEGDAANDVDFAMHAKKLAQELEEAMTLDGEARCQFENALRKLREEQLGLRDLIARFHAPVPLFNRVAGQDS